MHMIDMTNDRANIAYVGKAPWHELGAEMAAGASIEEWRKAAGLDYTVQATPVIYEPVLAQNHDGQRTFNQRSVLYRSDNGAPLSVVSGRYNVVQPGEALEFFRKLVDHNGFSLEVAGALDDGKRIWALARVGDGAPVIGHDEVRPYVLLATSYDGTMATTAKFTSVRVVCHNTLTMSAGYKGFKGEADYEGDGVMSAVRVPHSKTFDPDDVRMDLGIVLNQWERFLVQTRGLAATRVNEAFNVAFLKQLLPAPTKTVNGKVERLPVEDGAAFKAIMARIKEGCIGSEIPGVRGSAWETLNAVTEYVDHARGGERTRLSSAWFGSGEALKNRAAELLVAATA